MLVEAFASVVTASMEPRPEGRGDGKPTPLKLPVFYMLQWSHAPKGVETTLYSASFPWS